MLLKGDASSAHYCIRVMTARLSCWRRLKFGLFEKSQMQAIAKTLAAYLQLAM